jgi:hypothetical protein
VFARGASYGRVLVQHVVAYKGDELPVAASSFTDMAIGGGTDIAADMVSAGLLFAAHIILGC